VAALAAVQRRRGGHTPVLRPFDRRAPGATPRKQAFHSRVPRLRTRRTIKDRLRVLQPNDPDSYYATREIVPNDMLDDVNREKIVITNFHAFKLRRRSNWQKAGDSFLKGALERS
jgi:hypothetical protein